MSGEQCLATDWSTVGYEDGARGYTSDRFGNYRKACGKHGVTPDFAAYQGGRSEGLQEFCQPGRGFSLGAGGGRYYGVCDADLEPGFLDAYRTGQQLHALQSSVHAADSAIAARERELLDIAAAVVTAEARVISSKTTTEDRMLLLRDLQRMAERRGQLEAEIDALFADRARYEQELMSFEQVVAARGY